MKTVIEKFFLSLATIACSLSFGLNYGLGNQNTYLIHGLTLIDPDFLTNDWFAHSVQHYHNTFSYVIILVDSLGLPIPESLASIELLLRILALAAAYGVIYTISRKQAFLSFLIILALIIAERTTSVAGSYILSPVLQPSSFGSVFLIISIYFFLRGDYFLSGLSMAFSGLMHTNYLLLGFVVFGIAHLFIGTKGIVSRGLSQFSIMLVIFALKLPFLLDMMSSEYGDEATYIFQFIRSPHHYVPNNYLYDFYHFFGWSILGAAGLKLLRIDHELKVKLLGLYIGLLIPIVLATILTTVVFIPIVSKLFFWRMAPFLILMAQIIFISSIIDVNDKKIKPFKSNKPIIPFAIVVGVILIYGWYIHKFGVLSKNSIFLTVLFVFLLAINSKQAIYKLFNARTGQDPIKSLTIAFVAIILSYGVNHGLNHSTLINKKQNSFANDLYAWAKSTDVSSIFLVPPSLVNFRLHGERAIVVDWKSTPIDPVGLIEWYNRIQDVSGKTGVRSYEEAKKAYMNIDLNNLKLIKDKYSANYAVLLKQKNTSNYGLPIVFKNSKFVVVSLDSL